jgi:hypothetical protein
MLIQLLDFEGAHSSPQPLDVAPREVDQALAEPALARGPRLGRRIRADDGPLEQEVEGDARVDDLRDRDAARAEGECLPRAQLLVSDGERDARDERRVAQALLDGQELIQRAVPGRPPSPPTIRLPVRMVPAEL